MPDEQIHFDFSMILCTLGRTQEIEQFLHSLALQGDDLSIQLIVVDQNTDDRLNEILGRYDDRFTTIHLRTTPGLSKARNLGLTQASGNLIAFPDDDCTYPPGLLVMLQKEFENNPETGVISTLVTDDAGEFSAGGRMLMQPCRITRKNVWWCGVSPSIFIRASAIGDIRFDETLGVGSGTIFGSGEETDLLLAFIEKGIRLDYFPKVVVHHPRFHGPWRMNRGWLYGCGMGRVLRKHRWSFVSVLYYAALQGVRAVQSLLTLRFRKMLFHCAMSMGRIRGYLAKF